LKIFSRPGAANGSIRLIDKLSQKETAKVCFD
jgi:hypothetical protein